METLAKDKILQYNSDTLEAVRKMFDLHKPGVMKDAVDILEEWVQKQNHFTKKNFDKRYLEMTIIVSKGSIERAKSRLDRSCTFRTLVPHLFEIYDIRSLHKKELIDIKHAVLPKMTKNHERVYMLRNTGQKFESTFMSNYACTIPTICEYLRRSDYAASNIVVLDVTEANITAVAKSLTLNFLQEVAALTLDCCGFRVKAIYFISSSKLIELIIAVFKQVLSAKLGQRLHIVEDKESLKDVIEKDILPKEYGGNEKPLPDLQEEWMDVLESEDHLRYLKNIFAARTDETLRQKDTFNEQYFGMPGTFRTINLD